MRERKKERERDCGIHMERASMHCQGTACTTSFGFTTYREQACTARALHALHYLGLPHRETKQALPVHSMHYIFWVNHIQRASIHCQGTACTTSFGFTTYKEQAYTARALHVLHHLGLSSAEGQKLECFK